MVVRVILTLKQNDIYFLHFFVDLNILNFWDISGYVY